MYAIYGNIYHQYTPFMLAYIAAPWILWEKLDKKKTNKNNSQAFPQVQALRQRLDETECGQMQQLMRHLSLEKSWRPGDLGFVKLPGLVNVQKTQKTMERSTISTIFNG